MNRDQKAAVVDEIAGQLQAAEAIFAVDYRGISVAQVAELRSKLRDADAKFRIVKNSLTERAADKAGVEALKPMLEGPTALTLVHGDAALAAKALNDTARALNILEFKGGLMNGTALTADDVRSIARLPSRDVLNAQLVGTIAAPLTGLVRTLNALIAGLAIQLQAIADWTQAPRRAKLRGRRSVRDQPEGASASEASPRAPRRPRPLRKSRTPRHPSAAAEQPRPPTNPSPEPRRRRPQPNPNLNKLNNLKRKPRRTRRRPTNKEEPWPPRKSGSRS